MKKIKSLIEKHGFAVTAACIASVPASSLMIIFNYRNVAAIASAVFGIITVVRLIGWRLGDIPFSKDTMWGVMKGKKRSDREYREACFESAAEGIIWLAISFALAVVAFIALLILG